MPAVAKRPKLSARDLLLAVDTETTGLNLHHEDRPFMISTCTPDGISKCWEWRVNPISRKPVIPPQEKAEVAEYLKNKILVFHNGGFDLRALSEVNFEIHFLYENLISEDSPPWEDAEGGWIIPADPRCKGKPVIIQAQSYHDTQLMGHACSSGDEFGRLKSLAVRHLRYPDNDEDELSKAVGIASRFCKSHGIEWTPGHDLTMVKDTKTGKRKPKRNTKADYWLPKFVWTYIQAHREQLQADAKKGKPFDFKRYEFLKDVCLKYAVKDAERTILLALFYFELMKELGVTLQYEKERRLLQTVYKMENEGITFSEPKRKAKVKALSKPFIKHKTAAEAFGTKKLKRPINLGSYKDMQELLYQKLKLPEQVKIKKQRGERVESLTTDAKAIEALLEATDRPKSPHHNKQAAQFLKDLLISRKYQKGIEALTSYSYYALPTHQYKGIYLLYPNLNQCGAGSTTRFSSSNPNGQNVSAVAEFDVGGVELVGPRIRDIFVPPPGYRWYATDYSQLELRIFAFVSREQSLIDALAAGYDFHEYVAMRIFNLKPGVKPTKQQRRTAKNTNFAIIFGASPWKVDLTAGISGAYEQFAGLFPNVAAYMREMIDRARRDHFVYTVDGYRLDIPHSEPYKIVSYQVQGTAGRIIKNAMVAIDRQRIVDWQESRIALQVHDELLTQHKIYRPGNPHEHAPVLHAIHREMEGAGKALGIYTPVSCDMISSDWGHGEKVEVTATHIRKIKKEVA